MRLSYIVLVAAATLVATGNALSIEADVENRHLRSHKVDSYNFEDAEERGGNDWKAVFKRLLGNDAEYRKTIFASWKGGMQTVDDAATFMRGQGLKEAHVQQLKDAYAAYRRTNRR
ncbi:Avirulence (Avh) protein [Phytophthora megakarya]|uniref:RxLR effector protein n=1 Tax=Phytophthora megakarya TaxID=4795 RepID=A0A225V2X3_9STRA|nr:Avirulence (Avh) protein [Phytophthora megakarya]